MSPTPPITFSSFLVSLASTALAHLGHVDNPSVPVTDVDVHVARQTIDVINLLAEKTKGNLDEEELHLLTLLQKELAEALEASRTTAAR